MVYNLIFHTNKSWPGIGSGWFKIQEAGLTNAACKSSHENENQLSNNNTSTKLGNTRSCIVSSSPILSRNLTFADRSKRRTINHDPIMHCPRPISSSSRTYCSSWRYILRLPSSFPLHWQMKLSIILPRRTILRTYLFPFLFHHSTPPPQVQE